MINATVFQAPKSEKTFIKTEYYPDSNGVATEFQCDQLWEVERLICESQKACLALSYLSPAKLLAVTLSAIFQFIKQRLEIVFGQSV